MPRGVMQWFDVRAHEGRVIASGREYPAFEREVEPRARKAGARVYFDVARLDGVPTAVRVRLRPGLRTSPKQRRVGDLAGAGRDRVRQHPVEAGRGGEPVTHRVHHQLRPALAPQVGGDFGAVDRAQQLRHFLDAPRDAPVRLAHAEDRVLVSTHRDGALDPSRPVELDRDQARDAAHGLAPAHVLRDALLVDAVLERDDEAVRRKIGLDQVGRPLGVVGLHANERDVDRLFLHQALDVAHVERFDAYRVAFGPGESRELKSVIAHVVDMLGPCVDQRHVMSRARHVSAGVTADRAGAHHHNSFSQFTLP